MKRIFSTTKYLLSMLLFLSMAQYAVAQCPDGQTELSVGMADEGFPGENSWILWDATAGTSIACVNSVPGEWVNGTSVEACALNGNNIELYTYESFGDGWNGGTISLTTSEDGSAYTNGCSANEGFVVYEGGSAADDNDQTAGIGDGGIQCDMIANGVLVASFTPECIMCTIECPADLTVSTDEGVCEATVTIPLPVVGADCLGAPAGVEVFEGALTTQIADANGDLADTPFSVTGVPATSAGLDVTGEVCVNGDFGATTEAPNVLDENGNLLIAIPGGVVGDCGGAYCTEFTMTAADYEAFAADGSVDFTLEADADVDPPFCASSTVQGILSVPSAVVLAVNDYNGGEDASDVYPIGTTDVTFTTLAPGGVPVECTFSVTVEDLVAPEFADCPNDFTVTLDPGDCNYTLNFDTAAMDNCPPVSEAFFQNAVWPAVINGATSGIPCSNAQNDEISYFRAFDLGGAPLDLTSVDMAFEFADGVTPVEVRVHELAAGADPTSFVLADLTLIGSDEFTPDGTINTIQNYEVEIPGLSGVKVFEFFTSGSRVGGGVGNIFAMDASGEIAPTFVQGCPVTVPGTLAEVTDLAAFGFNQGLIVQLNMTSPGVEVVQNSELGSGDALQIGVTTVSYTATDAAGNAFTCEFDVTVEEYPEELQTTTLACNGGINFSVDASCTAVITADMVLEGGPYGCYEDFVLEIGGIPANAISGNGTNAVTIDASSIPGFVANGMYGPFEISVIDPDAANNSCWNGDFMLEDKLAPVFDCDGDVTIACTTSTEPTTAPNPTGSVSAAAEDLGIEIPTTAATVETEVLTVSGAPAGAVITDVTVDVALTHTWISDLEVTLVGPDGTSAVLVSQSCGTADDMDASFNDDFGVLVCGPTPAISGDIAPVDDLSVFDGQAAGGDWYLIVQDFFNADGGEITDFAITLDWEIVLPRPIDIISEDCSEVTVDYSDEVADGGCTGDFASIITRTWTAVDAKGNVAESCVQTISVTRETLASLTLPLNWDGLGDNNPIIECSNTVLNADGELDPNFYGSPGGAGACGTIISYYTDVILPLCDQTCDYTNSSYKVVRKWTILDWCTGEILEPTQILKVMDTTAPVLSNLPDLTVSTDIWGCGATIDLPVAAATDNCTATESITYSWSSTAGTQVGNTFVLSDPAKTMPGAPVVITVTASDCCGNSSTTDFEVTVVDLVPPVVVAETSRTVSLSTDGLAKAFAEDFDDGSHDGCGPIGFFVKRMDNGSPCPSLDKFPPAGNDNAQFNESVHFCCADVANSPIMVQFRVCDDADMNGVIGSFGDNCNDAMVEVTVQDKLAPQILCPPNTTISCIDLAGIDLTDTDLLDGLFGEAVGAGTCNVEISQTAVGNENCGAGVIFRNFTATNAAGSNSCQQIITVTAGPTNSLTCNRISFDGLNNNIYNWCNVNDNTNDNDDDIPAITIDCDDAASFPEVLVDINGLCTEAGIAVEADTFNFAGGACKKYLVHYEVIDQCIFDDNYVDPTTGEIDPYNSDNGYFEFYLEIDAFDNEDPVPTCDDVTVTATTCTGVNAPISVTATDNCTDPAYFGFQWRLDVGADDSIDFPSSGWYATSEATPAQVGLSEFPIGTHRFFWIISDGCGNDALCSQLVTIQPNDKEPTPYCFDGLAVAVMPSTGSVQLWANDFDAGSFDNCAGDLLLTMIPEQDVDGLSDDDAYDASFDHSNVVIQPNGDYGFEFNCDYIENGVSAVIEVRVYVTDADGNYDYCTASLRLDDNFDACEDAAGTVTYEATGKLTTTEGEDVANTNVTVEASFPEFPMTENVAGAYAFDLIENVDYSIVPERNDNFLNGVTTFDIVLIQKHILGVDLLDSPYQLIAADVDNNCSISGADLVQIRKLILGKYANDELPNNSSWRFVETDYTFTNPQAPCNFSEVAEIFNMSANEINDFYGVKIADVNGSVLANATSEAETRSANNLEFVVLENNLSAGNTYNVDVLAKDFNDVFGFQYTMNFNDVEFVNVEAGALNVTENNFGISRNGDLVVSYDAPNGESIADDAVLFTVTVKANSELNVSEAISMSSETIAAEAYVGANLDIYGSEIVFRTNEGDVADAAFELYQNEPNPFNGNTVIEFVLPTTSEATLSVYDVTGKVLYTKVDTYAAKTVSSVTINRNELAATGVLYYKLESGDNVATMKMIVLE